jgi:hypothetical protein
MILKFEHCFYPHLAVAEAVARFSGLASLECQEEPDFTLVKVKAFAESLKPEHKAVFLDELANYALHQSIIMARAE